MASWTTVDEDATATCGHCDNCTRTEETVDRRNVTMEAWQILKIAEKVHEEKGRLSLAQLAGIARGTGKAEFSVSSRKRRGNATKAALNTETLIGEPITSLRKDVRCTIACVERQSANPTSPRNSKLKRSASSWS